MAENVRIPDTVGDPHNPEWTEEDFAQAIPFKEAHPAAYKSWKRSRDQPSPEQVARAYIGFRLAVDVVDGVKASGPGYSIRVERVLRAALAGCGNSLPWVRPI